MKTDMFERAMEWLEKKSDESKTEEEQQLIEWIIDVVWRDNDMRNS